MAAAARINPIQSPQWFGFFGRGSTTSGRMTGGCGATAGAGMPLIYDCLINEDADALTDAEN